MMGINCLGLFTLYIDVLAVIVKVSQLPRCLLKCHFGFVPSIFTTYAQHLPPLMPSAVPQHSPLHHPHLSWLLLQMPHFKFNPALISLHQLLCPLYPPCPLATLRMLHSLWCESHPLSSF